MKHRWNEQELLTCWTITDAENQLLVQRSDVGRVGFAILLKYFQIECRFPSQHKDVPRQAVVFIADQFNDVDANSWLNLSLQGRSCERYRSIIREHLGFQPATVKDGHRIQAWLTDEIVPKDQTPKHLKTSVLDWCQKNKIEPPTDERIDRIISAAVHTFESQFFSEIHQSLSPLSQRALDDLLITSSVNDDADTELSEVISSSIFSNLKTDPSRLGLATVQKEIEKLESINQLDLPVDLFTVTSQKILERYRLRTSTESIQELRRHPDPIRYTLLSAFCWQRRKMIIDSLVELLIQLVHRISVRAERKVITEIVGGMEKVYGKTVLLFRLAEAAVANPAGTVKEVLYPVVNEKTLEALVKEYHSKGPTYSRHVHTLLRSSYGHHYRRMLPLMLDTLIFRSNNDAHQPVIDALAWLKDHRNSRQQYIDCDQVPIDNVVLTKQEEILLETAPNGKQRINRINYEICVLQALRESLRCKEIWVEGADRFRNPDEDLPGDFNTKRSTYYEALSLPLEPGEFINTLRNTMQEALSRLDETLPENTKVRFRDYGKNRIVITPFDPQPEPTQLINLKGEIADRWPMTSLLDVVKEADLRTGFSDVFKSLGAREVLDRRTVQERLLLCLYGLGTNTGLKRMLSSNKNFTYRELLHIRHRYIEKNALREAVRRVVNATFEIRQSAIWGEGTTSCASDAKKFGAWDQNLMTEWHIRYGGRGVMIYWHVEKKSACIYSQLKRCSSSEVASMIEGVLRHCTDMDIEQHYVDSKGQSEVAFAFSNLLGFDLLPRLKAIASQKLYRPVSGKPDDYPNLQPILTRPINWRLIERQYDEMVKFTTALRLNTAEPESILRRFTRNNLKHPTYQALAELGKAVKTIFLCRYLCSEKLRLEINEGLNVIENWNSANGFIFYGKGGEIATNRLEDQETAVLSLHLLQACLVYVNTLMIQNVLAEPQWLNLMMPEDFRGLTPLIYNHVTPYGLFELDMNKRLPLEVRLAA